MRRSRPIRSPHTPHARPSRVLLLDPGPAGEPTYPLGLAYLAGYLLRAGVVVRGVDLRVDEPATLQRTLQQYSFDLVAIRVLSTTVHHAASAAAVVRSLQPSARIVAGGPHATLAPSDALDRIGADAVIRGDGERPLLAVLSDESDAPGVMRRGGEPSGVYVHPDLGELDFPDRKTFALDRYYRQGAFGALPRTAMIATRGCVRCCGYCAANALSLGSFRKRETDSVIEEIRQISRDHGVCGVVFEDDNILLDPAWGRALFERIAQRVPETIIDLPNGVNPDLVDEATIDAMAAAGVRSIAFGLESLHRDSLRAIERLFDLDHFVRVATYARKQGICTTGYFLIGLPQEMRGALLSQAAAIRRLPLDMAHASVLRRLPGQPLQLAGSARSDAVLGALRAAFYLLYYADPRRGARLFARAGGDLAGVRRLGDRAVHWLRG
jgi:anaerobic magnesium-protoporphyrin IX monomethyl ester cyclase